MDEADVRIAADTVAAALVAGNVEGAIEYLSDELKRNLGEVVALLPLPATEATIVSIDRASAAIVVVVRLVGETSDVELQTRWKDRGGEPRIVEVSHLSRTEREAPATEGEGEGEGEAEAGAGAERPAADEAG
jgi:hypothetical protein